MLQFGVGIRSIEVSKQKLHIAKYLCLQQNLQRRSIQQQLLSQVRRDLECFLESIGICAVMRRFLAELRTS